MRYQREWILHVSDKSDAEEWVKNKSAGILKAQEVHGAEALEHIVRLDALKDFTWNMLYNNINHAYSGFGKCPYEIGYAMSEYMNRKILPQIVEALANKPASLKGLEVDDLDPYDPAREWFYAEEYFLKGGLYKELMQRNYGRDLKDGDPLLEFAEHFKPDSPTMPAVKYAAAKPSV